MRDGVEFIAVVMHCATSDERFSSARALLDYGFANYTLLAPLPEEPLPAVPVVLGREDAVQPVPAQTEPVLAEKGAAASCTRSVALAETVEAPVVQGQRLGTVTLRSGDDVLAEIPLVAAEAVERLRWWDAAVRILRRACFG